MDNTLPSGGQGRMPGLVLRPPNTDPHPHDVGSPVPFGPYDLAFGQVRDAPWTDYPVAPPPSLELRDAFVRRGDGFVRVRAAWRDGCGLAVDVHPHWRDLPPSALPHRAEVMLALAANLAIGRDGARAVVTIVDPAGGMVPVPGAEVAGEAAMRWIGFCGCYAANARAVFGRALAAVTGKPSPLPAALQSLVGMQALHRLRAEGRRHGLLDGDEEAPAWSGTGKYPALAFAGREAAWLEGGAIRAGLVERTDDGLAMTDAGERFLDVLSPSEDPDMPLRWVGAVANRGVVGEAPAEWVRRTFRACKRRINATTA